MPFDYRTTELALETLSLEASFISNAKDYLANIFLPLNELMGNLKNKLFGLLDNDEKLDHGLSGTAKKVVSTNPARSYLHIASDLLIDVPIGLSDKMDHLSYANTLLTMMRALATIEHDVLMPLYVETSQFISNPQTRKSTLSNLSRFTLLDKQRKDLAEQFQRHFNGKDHSQMRLIDAFARQADFQPYYEALQELRRSMDRIHRASIKDNVNRISENLELIIKLTNNQEINSATPESAIKIGDAALVAARWVEFYTVIYFSVLTLSNCEPKMSEEVLKALQS